MSQSRLPSIDTAEFEEVYPFSQAKMVKGTPHTDGLCGPICSVFVESVLQKHWQTDFKKPDYAKLYQKAVMKYDKMVEVSGQGDDVDEIVFQENHLRSQVASITPQELSKQLEQAKVALISYKVKSDAYHQLGFAELEASKKDEPSHTQCIIHDSNRFTGVAKCPLAFFTLKKIIERSDPKVVHLNYVPK